MAAAVFGFVGVLVGAVIAGGVSLRIAKQTREAAERAWVRDNRREIYDRFLTCSQTLLNACEDADKSKTKEAQASIKTARLVAWHGVCPRPACPVVAPDGSRFGRSKELGIPLSSPASPHGVSPKSAR